ncbi:retroviral-like aspartic protease family protein [Paraburkholderia sp. BR14263]|uniref:retroviral-like aspartic protease family protein n=1 Tax=unclassified Paraburkholderia TaxID=2615204 RepID=UPI0034CDB398
MPIAEAGFHFPDGRAVPNALINVGPTIQVVVSALGPVVAAPAAGAAPVAPVAPAPAPTAQVVSGLIDTGAQQSCIDSDLAIRLGLPVVDRVMISGANGAHGHDVFAAQVSVPSLGITQTGLFAGVHLSGGQQPHQVLLGRTFLQNVVMVYDGRRAQVMVASANGFGFGGMMPFPSPVAPLPVPVQPATGAAPDAVPPVPPNPTP